MESLKEHPDEKAWSGQTFCRRQRPKQADGITDAPSPQQSMNQAPLASDSWTLIRSIESIHL